METKQILNADECRAVTTFLRGIDMLRSVDPKLGLGELLTFMHIAANPEPTLRVVAEDIGVSSTAISDYIRRLGPGRRGEEPGLDLLTFDISRRNCSKRVFELTPRGEMLVTQFLHVFDKTLKGPAGRHQAANKKGGRSVLDALSAAAT